MRKRIWRIAAACALITVLVMMCRHALSGYEASKEAIADMEKGTSIGHAQAFVPGEIRGGMIFYPGGLVDHRAYAPLMQVLCDRGVLCLLCDMPLDLAVLDMKAADGLQAQYPQVEKWLIGGHSLGGAMAASYVSDHAAEYDGLVLLGADFGGMQHYALLALPLLLLYSGKRGTANLKYFFYIFYPVHLAVLQGIAWIVG